VARPGPGTRVADIGSAADADRRQDSKPAGRVPGSRNGFLSPQPPQATDEGHALWQPWEPPPALRRTASAVVDFRHGTPALSRFPTARWRQSLADALARADDALLGYGLAEGSPALRAEISTLTRHSRALDAPPERIMVTSGATQAMDILVRALISPGDVVVIEDPSHTVLRQIFGFSHAAVVPVAVDDEGLRVADIDAAVRAHGHDPTRVRLVYVTPSHQFPTGTVMSGLRRRALVAWAQERGATVLEDDYHNEYWFSGDRLPALAAEPRQDAVVYVGSFSKTLFPALRIGYAILPEHLVRPFLGIKWITDRLTPTVEQEALAEFIASGAYGHHIAKMSRLYKQRRLRLLEALYEHFGAGVRISGEAAGLHVLVAFPGLRGTGEADLARRAAERGVLIYPASGYYVQDPPTEPTFLMGYAALPAERITEGVARLAAAVRQTPGPG
jgi:GntR family transcriptional regulator/MocR family aminotransferase